MRDHQLERVARLAQRGHRRHDGVAEMLGVLFRGAVAFVVERPGELVGAALQLVGQLRQRVERLLSLHRPAARRFDRGHALGDRRLVVERRRKDVAVGHQDHQLAFDVHRLVVGLEHDLVARVQLARVEDLVFCERCNHVLGDQLRQRVDGVLQVLQAAPAGLDLPLP